MLNNFMTETMRFTSLLSPLLSKPCQKQGLNYIAKDKIPLTWSLIENFFLQNVISGIIAIFPRSLNKERSSLTSLK